MISFNQFKVKDYNLDRTLNGGQTFVWDKSEDGNWYGKTINGLIILKQEDPANIKWQTYPIKNDVNLVKKYLRIDFNYDDLLDKTLNDPFFVKSLEKFKGMRLLNQNVNEVIISYIISANNSYVNIKNSIRKLAIMFGDKVEFNGVIYNLFPHLDKLANSSIQDIKNASVGYRAEYILETARMIQNTDSGFIFQKNDEGKIREELLKLKGVGNKVADCVLAFGYGFDNVAPIDVWVGRVLEKFYGVNKKTSYKKMREWTKNNMHGYASWVSQYLFEYIRNLN